MPTIIKLFGYYLFFWSNENEEPVHIHVCKGQPSAQATKIWVPAGAPVRLEHNHSNIPQKDLNRILKWVSQNKRDIRYRWDIHFDK